MNLSKSIGSLVLSAIVVSSVSPLANANEVQESSQKVYQPQYVNVDGVKINRNPDLPQNPQAQERIGATKVAIKFIINHKSDARKVIKKVGGNKAANLFDKAYSPIVKELKPLLKLSDVPAQAVGDAAYRGALNAGLSKGNAGIISTTIKESISWLF
ncbi:hypothetical protein [Staphylococcus epidermidis]|uniref:hypothetical protein n=1 Tax=Staphylococcus epidermidis TaxID=1282 RepID=UPI00215BC82D|nr:hypothetical protein [Staphylococcus epidermidis]MCR9005633.1 hypothetical protein [Staphylococcus epidermidis]UYO28232.1 hypothetical protein LQF30_07735 [Staphylococcus epidermidis]